jgi:hypothetical protein
MKQLSKIVTLLSILTVFKLVEVFGKDAVGNTNNGGGLVVHFTGTEKDVEAPDNHPA